MAKSGSYAGKIKNQGTQNIKAPFGGSDRKGTQKITGNDLRTGNKKSGK